jgi:DNA-binding NarL/FixJ family response regulator
VTGEPVEVGLVIAHDVTREGVTAVLEAGGVPVRAAASDAAGLLRATRGRPLPVCIVDGALPGGCLEAVDALAATGTAVVVIAPTEDEHELLRVVEAGACGLLPHSAAGRLADVVRGVAAGEAAVSRRLVRLLLDRVRSERRTVKLRDADGRSVELSPREAAVLQLIAAGASAAEAADHLGITAVTARRHLSMAVRKLGVPDRAAAVAALRAQAAPA